MFDRGRRPGPARHPWRRAGRHRRLPHRTGRRTGRGRCPSIRGSTGSPRRRPTPGPESCSSRRCRASRRMRQRWPLCCSARRPRSRDDRWSAGTSPSAVNRWMSSLTSSTTYTLPSGPTSSSNGSRNCPSPLPKLPQLNWKPPSGPNFWTRRLAVSATYTEPSWATATPPIALNGSPGSRRKSKAPSVDPVSPQRRTSVPSGSSDEDLVLQRIDQEEVAVRADVHPGGMVQAIDRGGVPGGRPAPTHRR